MRPLTLLRLLLALVVLSLLILGVVLPGMYLFIESGLPVQIDDAHDIEVNLRQTIESERQGVELGKQPKFRVSPKWPRPDFALLPKQVIALYITETGCPDYFRSAPEHGKDWYVRLLASARGQILDGDGACELIFARNIARRLSMRTDLQVVVASDRVHKFLGKEELVAFDLESVWFEPGIIGLSRASDVLLQKSVNELSLAEMAELQIALPPWGAYEDLKECRNGAKVKEARDALLLSLASVGHVDEATARAAIERPLRCTSVKR